ncbi:MAG: exodeoxyribonuclease VII small subunit [Methylacidiphilales bacterium]|nr:exodeoxyribonuclease VII small subunit [Candidatus Methylacidiphilales bacterium]
MSKAAKDMLTFESALGRLEEIVAQMESAELPLDKIIDKYEEGMKLLGFCEEKLEASEKKIELLTRDKAGKLQRGELESAESQQGDSRGDGPSETSLF